MKSGYIHGVNMLTGCDEVAASVLIRRDGRWSEATFRREVREAVFRSRVLSSPQYRVGYLTWYGALDKRCAYPLVPRRRGYGTFDYGIAKGEYWEWEYFIEGYVRVNLFRAYGIEGTFEYTYRVDDFGVKNSHFYTLADGSKMHYFDLLKEQNYHFRALKGAANE